MSNISFSTLAEAFRSNFTALHRYVEHRHQHGHEHIPEKAKIPAAPGLERMAALIGQLHRCNFILWHLEDQARKTDAGAEKIMRVKQAIDKRNQARNDSIEQLDDCLVTLLTPLLPADSMGKYNTETLGAAMDRLSILSLKMYHMQEETNREDAGAEHTKTCRDKLAVMAEQRRDLEQAILDVLEEYAQGKKTPKIYRQFKMYNDPTTNPELYRAQAKTP